MNARGSQHHASVVILSLFIFSQCRIPSRGSLLLSSRELPLPLHDCSMFPIGLNLPASRTPKVVDPGLLRGTFSISDFLALVIKRKPKSPASPRAPPELFPDMAMLEVFSINNIRNGPKVCAADDLDLSLSGGDQFEYFDTYFSAPRDRFHDPLDFDNALPFDVGVPDFSPNSAALHPALSLLSLFHYENPTDVFPGQKPLPVVHILQHSLPQTYSRLETPYFNDFTHPQTAALYGSLAESYALPLDEMFLPKARGASAADAALDSTPSVSSMDMRTSVDIHDMTNTIDMRNSVHMAEPVNMRNSMDLRRSVDLRASAVPVDLGVSMDMHMPVTEIESRKRRYRSPELIYGEELPSHAPSDSKKLRTDGGELFKFVCNQCNASFKVRSYLTRHLRKHNNAKAFMCPFFEETEEEATSTARNGTRCHPTGGFSRRDTFKTHLKALHFIYPPGTKSTDRNTTGGRCAGCFEFFESNTQWVTKHIEGGACKGTVGTVKVKNEDS